jgi:hypothetical protein
MTTRLILLPDAPSTAPIHDLLRLLKSQELGDDSLRLVERSDTGLVVRTLGATSEDDSLTTLNKCIEAARSARFIVFNVVTADGVQRAAGTQPSAAVGPDEFPPEVRTALEVDRVIRAAIATLNVENDVGAQRLDVVNLMLPTASPGCLPVDLHVWGDENSPSGWSHVVVAPEVQETANQGTVLIDPNEAYVAHAAVAILTHTGLWAGRPWEPFFPAFDDDAGQSKMWTIVRSRSRSVIAPELPNRVLGRIGRAVGRLPTDDRMEFRVVPDPKKAVKLARERLIAKGSLNRDTPVNVDAQPDIQRVGFKQFFRILWQWMTGRMYEYVEGEIQHRVEASKRRVNKFVNRALGLDDTLDIRVNVFGLEQDEFADDPEDSGDLDSEVEEAFNFLRPEPLVWSSLRSMCFGLLDGGDLPDEKTQKLLGVGDQRFVLPDGGWISPSPGVPLFEPSQAVRDLGMGPSSAKSTVDIDWARAWESSFARYFGEDQDQTVIGSESAESSIVKSHASSAEGSDSEPEVADATDDPVAKDRERFKRAMEDARRSLLWQMSEHLFTQRLKTVVGLESLEEQLAEAKEDDGKAAESAAKKTKRSASIRAVFSLILLLGIGAIGAFGIISLKLSGALLVFASVVLVMFWTYCLFRIVWRCIYAWFKADHRLYWARNGREAVIEGAIRFELLQLERFEYLCAASTEWSEIIALICHHPFRQPRPVKSMRVRQPNLHLPSSHQIREGFTSSARLDGLVSAVAADIIRQGWLGHTFTACQGYAQSEALLRNRNEKFDPDRDVLTGDTTIGDRKVLLDAIDAGRARRYREIEVLLCVYRSILNENVDDLFTPYSGDVAISEFLGEGFSGVPSNFNKLNVPMFTEGGVPLIPARTNGEFSAQQTIGTLPRQPTVEELIGGVEIEFPSLVYTSWGLDTLDKCDQDLISVFGDQYPAQLDLSRAVTLWKPPPENELPGELLESPPTSRPEWVLTDGDLPLLGDLISRDLDFRAQSELGPFAFIREVDGEPLSHLIGVPIRYAVRRDCAPPNALSMIRKGLQNIANVTGHEFRFDGTFVGLPKKVDRIEIGWALTEEYNVSEKLNGHEVNSSIGLGGPGSATYDPDCRKWILKGGTVLLNADMSEHYEVDYVSGYSHGEVLLHELGHVMNLHHVTSPEEIMTGGAAAPGPNLRLGPGDEHGLRQIVSNAAQYYK